MADQFYTIDIRRALFEIHGFIFTIEMQGCTDRTSQLVKVLVEVSHCKKKKKSQYKYLNISKKKKERWIFFVSEKYNRFEWGSFLKEEKKKKEFSRQYLNIFTGKKDSKDFFFSFSELKGYPNFGISVHYLTAKAVNSLCSFTDQCCCSGILFSDWLSLAAGFLQLSLHIWFAALLTAVRHTLPLTFVCTTTIEWRKVSHLVYQNRLEALIPL